MTDRDHAPHSGTPAAEPPGASDAAGISGPHDSGDRTARAGWGAGWDSGSGRGSGAHAATDEEATGPRRPGKLRRDTGHGVIGGVCSGLGRHCDMDPVIFRIGLAVLAATGGLGLIFYGFAWLLVPADGQEDHEGRRLLSGRVDGVGLTAVLFALIGCGLLLSMVRNGGVMTFAAVLGLLLAGAGYWSQQRKTVDPDPVTAQTVADAPPEAKAPPVAAPKSWWRDPIEKDGSVLPGSDYLWGPPDAAAQIATELHLVPREPADGITTARPGEPERAAPQGPPGIGGWVFLLALLAGGLGLGLTWEGHPLTTTLQTGFACALAVTGLGIAVSAFLGRTGPGLVILGVLTAAALTAATAVPENISTHWIRTEWKPTAAGSVKPHYELGTGVGTLDLRGIDLAENRTLRTAVEVGAGRAVVRVPRDVTLKVDVEVGAGDIRLPEWDRNDVFVNVGENRKVTLPPPVDDGTAQNGRGTDDPGAAPGTRDPDKSKTGSSDKGGGTIELRLEVGVGQVEVIRAAS